MRVGVQRLRGMRVGVQRLRGMMEKVQGLRKMIRERGFGEDPTHHVETKWWVIK
jgi:hypothetical protein